MLDEIQSVEDLLRGSTTLVRPVLREWINKLPDSLRRVADYHFGWRDIAGREIPQAASGKGMRACLSLVCGSAVGGSSAMATPAAVAIELVHNSTLIHDDIIDKDRERHHRATVWSAYGVPVALLVGDALQCLADKVIASEEKTWAAAGVDWLTTALLSTLDGQMADAAFEKRQNVSLTECLSMVEGKAGALMGCSAGIGALAGGSDLQRATYFRDFGFHLGMAYQLIDDSLALWGDPSVTGKPVGGDIQRRKKSTAVIAAMTSDTAAGRKLMGLYANSSPFSTAEVTLARRLVEESGAREWANAAISHQLTCATEALKEAAPSPEAAGWLRLIMSFVEDRDA